MTKLPFVPLLVKISIDLEFIAVLYYDLLTKLLRKQTNPAQVLDDRSSTSKSWSPEKTYLIPEAFCNYFVETDMTLMIPFWKKDIPTVFEEVGISVENSNQLRFIHSKRVHRNKSGQCSLDISTSLWRECCRVLQEHIYFLCCLPPSVLNRGAETASHTLKKATEAESEKHEEFSRRTSSQCLLSFKNGLVVTK